MNKSNKMKTHLLRGEVWISPNVLMELGMPDSYRGIVEFAKFLQSDICFFSCTGLQPLGYDLRGLIKAINYGKTADLICGAIIDGPWQRLATANGLWALINMVAKHESALLKQLDKQYKIVSSEFQAWIDAGADILIIADDIAYKDGLYFSSDHFSKYLLSFYISLLDNKRDALDSVGFHSDGNISNIILPLLNAGFNSFLIEPETMNLKNLLTSYRNEITLLSFIKAEWLYKEILDENCIKEILENYLEIIYEGSIIMSSTCGLNNLFAVNNIKLIYSLIDSLCSREFRSV